MVPINSERRCPKASTLLATRAAARPATSRGSTTRCASAWPGSSGRRSHSASRTRCTRYACSSSCTTTTRRWHEARPGTNNALETTTRRFTSQQATAPESELSHLSLLHPLPDHAGEHNHWTTGRKAERMASNKKENKNRVGPPAPASPYPFPEQRHEGRRWPDERTAGMISFWLSCLGMSCWAMDAVPTD